MFEIIIGILGIIASALYVGFLAYKIDAIPLWVIVIGTFVLIIREFVAEVRENAKRASRKSASS